MDDEAIWKVVEWARSSGWTYERLLQEVKECWAEAIRQELASFLKEHKQAQ